MIWTARCYCGAQHLQFDAAPLVVAFCHCADCRRWTGAPAPAFVAFADDACTATPPLGAPFVHTEGVERRSCAACGSPMLARFAYLPGQFYVPVGVMDQATDLKPEMHCHSDKALVWVQTDDGLPLHDGSARTALGQASS